LIPIQLQIDCWVGGNSFGQVMPFCFSASARFRANGHPGLSHALGAGGARLPGEMFAPKRQDRAKGNAGLGDAVKILLPEIVIRFMKSTYYLQDCARLKLGAQP
jgi:hypothetical protein